MRVLYVADGRSPIALNWMRYFVERGDQVFLASTFACKPGLPLQRLQIIPVAFSGARAAARANDGRSPAPLRWRTALRHLLGPLTIRRAASRLRRFIEESKPDLVHAMRIPFEGMLAADGRTQVPLLVSVWGNDFTLHASATPLMRHYTEWTMEVADALHADCHRDVRLARQFGLDVSRPTLVIPGAGGVRPEIFHPPDPPSVEPLVVNPRGERAYVRTEAFLHAIPQVLERMPEARFVCVSLAGHAGSAHTVRRLGIGHAVQLLPQLEQRQLAELLRRAQVMVSPSVHDGTPNTLLEAMACGCLPIAGDLESIREWIRDGQNGLLVDANDPAQLAQAILRALQDKDLRHEAAGLNKHIIQQRAQFGPCMQQAAAFYQRVLEASTLTA